MCPDEGIEPLTTSTLVGGETTLLSDVVFVGPIVRLTQIFNLIIQDTPKCPHSVVANVTSFCDKCHPVLPFNEYTAFFSD
jgi:hypothetical protein